MPPAPTAPTPAPAPSPPKALPKVDVHLHVAPDASDLALQILREQGIVVGLNASGGALGQGLEASAAVARASGGRLLPLCNVPLGGFAEPGWSEHVTALLTACKRLGGKGVKISKFLGLGLTGPDGHIVAVDDPRLDALFEAAGAHALPVLIHSGDPRAFFEPATPANERFEELRVHPSWSFHGLAPNGEPWPSWEALLDQHERRVARHPKTIFVGAHFGGAPETPERVGRMLDRLPNYFVDTAARVPELGRHAPATLRAFFARYQDRILFGSDLGVSLEGLVLGSGGNEPGTREGARVFFERHWAYFETNARAIAHPTPIQGSWSVDAIGLPREVLEKIYLRNAVRIFDLTLDPNQL